ncbi:replication initiation protein [Spirosoma agri]|uniref:Replication initiation protein n=1 Tax=Spirosoma agri TaxID=1987381 RepID=A0A6M0IP85_9BACT|nr:replication initiation protein [Spirosoma agri]NEU70139.1 replication initiation protein [Spirosoma agri]
MAKETKVRRRSEIGERTIARMKAGRNGIVEATYRMDVVEFRVFFTMLTMISPDDVTFCEYELRVADIIRLFSLSRDGRSYETIKEAAERLVNKTMVIYHTKEDGNRYRTVIPFLTSASSLIGDTKMESIRVTFHPELKPFLLQLRTEYLEFDVRNLARVQSQYSIRLYMMLRHQMNLKKTSVRYTVERLREVFEIGDKDYPLYGNFKQKVLVRACTDLNATTNIRIDEMEEERTNRKVVAVVFHMSPQDLPLLIPETRAEIAGETPLVSPATKKQKAVVEIDDPETNLLVDELHGLIAQYIGRDAVRTWLHQSSEEQIRKAIDYTLKQIKQGTSIKNIGGYLQKMVNTSLPLSFDAPEPVPEKTSPPTGDKNKTRQQQQALEEARLEALTGRKYQAALQALTEHPDWHEAVSQHMQSGLFGKFYKEKLSLYENVKNPAMYGPFFQIIERLKPDVFNQIQ